MKEIRLGFVEEEYKKLMTTTNEEILDWKQAAKAWGEGKKIEWLCTTHTSGSPVWEDKEDLESPHGCTWYQSAKYRIKAEPVVPVKWAMGAYFQDGWWYVTKSLYPSLTRFKESFPQNSFWPAGGDDQGFLIIPKEFQHLNNG